MNSFFQFLLELNLSLLLGFGVYWTFLRKQSWHQWNRRFLIGWPLLCISIALLQIDYTVMVERTEARLPFNQSTPLLPETSLESSGLVASSEAPQAANSTTGKVASSSSISFLNWWQVYFAGAFITFLIFALRLKDLTQLIRMGLPQRQDGFILLEHPAYPQVFSFGRYIFKQKDQILPEMVLTHELVHVRQRHSLDLLWMEVLLILNWFNPILYLYRKQLKETHEYIADQAVVQQYGLLEYARLLVAQATGSRVPALALPFAAFTKKRIIAMKTKTKNPWSRLRYWIVLPLFLLLVSVFALNRVEQLKPIPAEVDATVQWGDLTCDCYESSMADRYFCDLKELSLTEMQKITSTSPTISIRQEEQFIEEEAVKYSYKKIPFNNKKETTKVYFSEGFISPTHELWSEIDQADKVIFKATLSSEKVIQFQVGIKSARKNQFKATAVRFADQTIHFDERSNQAQQDMSIREFLDFVEQPQSIIYDNKTWQGKNGLMITRTNPYKTIHYHFQHNQLGNNGPIRLDNVPIFKGIQSKDRFVFRYWLPTGNSPILTINIKEESSAPKNLIVKWGVYQSNDGVLKLNYQDLDKLKNTTPKLLFEGKAFEPQTDIYAFQPEAAPLKETDPFKMNFTSYEAESYQWLINRAIEDWKNSISVKEKQNDKELGQENRGAIIPKYNKLLLPLPDGEYYPLVIDLIEGTDLNEIVVTGIGVKNIKQTSQFNYPVAPKNIEKISFGFGPRVHPIYKTRKLHTGMDIIGPMGTPVLAASYGEVIEVEQKKTGYGKKIVIQHADGLTTVYAHLQSIQVKVGDRLSKKAMIGTLGSSGTSIGPHLHFEVRENGKPKDPMQYLSELEK